MLTLGQPFYSGYGVTLDVDSLPRDPRRRCRRCCASARPRADPAVPARRDARVLAGRAGARRRLRRERARARRLARRRGRASPRAEPRRAAEPRAARRARADRARARRGGLGARGAAACAPRSSARDDVELRAGRAAAGRAAGASVARPRARARVVPVGLPRARRRAGADVLHCPLPLAPPRAHRVPTRGDRQRRAGAGAPGVVHARERAAAAARRSRPRCAAPRACSCRPRTRASAWWRASRRSTRSGRASCRAASTRASRPGPRAAARRRARTCSPSARCSRARTSRRRWPRSSALRPTGSSIALVVVGRARLARRRAGRAAAASPAARADRPRRARRRRRARRALPRRRRACCSRRAHEGFGFPPLEAMACGTPGRVPPPASLPEVARRRRGARATPTTTRRSRAASRGVLGDPEPGGRAGLARAAEFTWERCAELTVAAYAAALGAARAPARSPRRRRRCRALRTWLSATATRWPCAVAARLLGVLAELGLEARHRQRALDHPEARRGSASQHERVVPARDPQLQVVVDRDPVALVEAAGLVQRLAAEERRRRRDEVVRQVEAERVAAQQRVLVGGDGAADLAPVAVDDPAVAGEPHRLRARRAAPRRPRSARPARRRRRR